MFSSKVQSLPMTPDQECKDTYRKMINSFVGHRNKEALEFAKQLLDNPFLSTDELEDVRHVYKRTKDIDLFT